MLNVSATQELAAQMEALTKAVTTLQQKEKADVRTVSLDQ
jgi:hypothetical protein